MIPAKVKAIFEFIDFLDKNKKEYIETYIPLINTLTELDRNRNELNPRANYKDKQQYDLIQKEIEVKLSPLYNNVILPILDQLKKQGIWEGDNHFISIYNDNADAALELTKNFTDKDVKDVEKYKQKYLRFRTETNSNFLTLGSVFNNLDEVLKILFDFFKDTEKNEFETFETKAIQINSINETVELFQKGHRKFILPTDFLNPSKAHQQTETKTELENKPVLKDKPMNFDLRNKEQFPVLHGIEDYLLRFRFLRIINQHIGIINNFMKGKELGKDRDTNSEFFSQDLIQLIGNYKRESIKMASDCYNYFDELKNERDGYFAINIQGDEQRFFFIKQYNLRVIKEIDTLVSQTEKNIRSMYYIFINEPQNYPVDLKVCFGNWYKEFDNTNEQNKLEHETETKNGTEFIPKPFYELFIKPSLVNDCLNLLREIEKPCINDENEFIGRSKGIFIVWFIALQDKKMFSYNFSNDKERAETLNHNFPSLNISESLFRQPNRRATDNYKTYFGNEIAAIKTLQP
jgi:hypothetical protein